MKKIFSLIVLAAGFLYLLILPVNAESFKGYVILVYMNGSNLESDKSQATKAINEMIKVTGDKKFPGCFIVETGGTKNWHLDELQKTKNQRFLIADGTIKQMYKLPSRSIGNSENFKDFLIFGMQQPANHYMLIFWNHGEGSLKGFGNDELYSNDTLTLDEIRQGFENANITKKFDLIGFDTCLMSTIEIANLLSKYGTYMLASQETEKQGGWNYEMFSKLTDVNMRTEKLAKSIMDEYVQGETQYSITLWRLEKVGDLVKSLETALNRWGNRYNILATKTLSLRKDMLDFGGNLSQKNLIYIYPEMVDLDEVMSVLAGGNNKYLDYYLQVKKTTVVYHLNKGYSKEASGINLFLPYGSNFTEEDLGIYKTTGFSDKYISFIEQYYCALNTKNKFEIDNAPVSDDSETISLKTNTDNINDAYIALFKSIGNRRYTSLGYMKYNTTISNGKIKAEEPKQWIYALNQAIYVEQIGENTFITPMLLKRNNNETMINIEFTQKNNSFMINKISELDEHFTVSRNLERIQKGDILTPIYSVYKFNDINKKFVSDLIKPISYQKGVTKNVILDNIIGFKIQNLNTDDYQLRFILKDKQGNKHYSLPVRYKKDE